MKNRRQARGQTLLLWGLMLLWLTVMVLVTLGIGMRARQRIDLQMAADTAAYSQAVVTARTLNSIALLNRAQIAHMVAMASVQSLISWSGQIKGGLPKIEESLTQLAQKVTDKIATGLCTQADADDVNNALAQYLANQPPNLDQLWKLGDVAAGKQALDLQGAARMLDEQQLLLDKLKEDQLTTQNMTEAIAHMADPDLLAVDAGDRQSLSAVNVIVAAPNSTQAVHIAMGSRGHEFTRNRRGRVELVDGFLAGFSANISVIINARNGGSGFGGNRRQDRERSQKARHANGGNAWAEDHPMDIQSIYSRGLCSERVDAPTQRSWVMSSDEPTRDDQHDYHKNVDYLEFEPSLPDERHTMGPCDPPNQAGPCGIWPGYMDYDPSLVDDASRLYGQPVLFSIVHRDLSLVDDPWNKQFSFPLFSNNAPAFDNASKDGMMTTQPELRLQVALSAGIAYYHRPQRFKEPPNLYNPFWRATLVSSQRLGAAVVAQRLNEAGFPTHADAVQRLRAQGFRGAP